MRKRKQTSGMGTRWELPLILGAKRAKDQRGDVTRILAVLAVMGMTRFPTSYNDDAVPFRHIKRKVFEIPIES